MAVIREDSELIRWLVAEKTCRGDAVTEKIERDPAARIRRPALKKKTQLHRGALKMIFPHSKSNEFTAEDILYVSRKQ